MTLHLYPRSCVILHERTVHGTLRRYEPILNRIIFFPHYVNDNASLLLQWLTSLSSSSILPPPYACIYIQDAASFLMSLAPPRCPAYSSSVYLFILLPHRDHHPRSSLLYLHNPSCPTSSCCTRVATVPDIYQQPSPVCTKTKVTYAFIP